MVSRYTGTFFILQSVLAHYFILSNPFSWIVFVSGLFCIFMAGLSAALLRISRSFFYSIRIFAILPFLIGVTGTILLIHNSSDAAWMEKERGLISSEAKYYDWQYGFCRTLLYALPVSIGALSSISAVALVRLIRRKTGTL